MYKTFKVSHTLVNDFDDIRSFRLDKVGHTAIMWTALPNLVKHLSSFVRLMVVIKKVIQSITDWHNPTDVRIVFTPFSCKCL